MSDKKEDWNIWINQKDCPYRRFPYPRQPATCSLVENRICDKKSCLCRKDE